MFGSTGTASLRNSSQKLPPLSAGSLPWRRSDAVTIDDVERALDPGDLLPYVALPSTGVVLPRLPVSVEIAPGHAGVSVLETQPAEVSVRPQRERSQP